LATPPAKQYYGLSTDTKPTSDVPVGRIFNELNTGIKWIWSGSEWVEELSMIWAISQANNI
jgi:hypothetical protein